MGSGATGDLSRFARAQDGVYEIALAELRAGRKATHWMWFIFPQLASLGRSATAKFYGIADLAEARAYLAEPVLGPRLAECFRAVLGHDGLTAEQIMGHIDGLKLRSSATLFREAGSGEMAQLAQAVLDRFYGGEACPLTMAELGEAS
ncbi:DUF1810 domain-containing protein [Acidimangrovimonas pyrenivorans]|uniref:DUF1810 domain-containing protein n=1 Tax=Acidimangrovimonas pyrenivorans TaxID=2030798 RepID=A0ABV7AGJ7_9RHOB